MQGEHVAGREERSLALRDRETRGAGTFARALAGPNQHLHAESAAGLRNAAPDTPEAEDAEDLAAQGTADPHLPVAGL